MQNVLVTGGAGFLGRHVARYCAGLGFSVSGIGHGRWPAREARAAGYSTWHDADITCDALVAHAGVPDIVIHCAGSASVAFSIAHPKEDFERSVETTRAALEFIRQHAPAARFVLPSSAAVYGNVARLPIPEDAPANPISPYGVHKRAAEELCATYAARYGIATAVVRLFSVYGPGLRKQLLWDACEKLRRGDAKFSGNGEERRDWLYVTDAAALVATAAGHASPACLVTNGGSGRAASVREVVQKLAAAFPDSGPATFSGIHRSGDPNVLVADIARATSWGWQPAMTLDRGIAHYLDWYAREVGETARAAAR